MCLLRLTQPSCMDRASRSRFNCMLAWAVKKGVPCKLHRRFQAWVAATRSKGVVTSTPRETNHLEPRRAPNVVPSASYLWGRFT